MRLQDDISINSQKFISSSKNYPIVKVPEPDLSNEICGNEGKTGVPTQAACKPRIPTQAA